MNNNQGQENVVVAQGIGAVGIKLPNGQVQYNEDFQETPLYHFKSVVAAPIAGGGAQPLLSTITYFDQIGAAEVAGLDHNNDKWPNQRVGFDFIMTKLPQVVFSAAFPSDFIEQVVSRGFLVLNRNNYEIITAPLILQPSGYGLYLTGNTTRTNVDFITVANGIPSEVSIPIIRTPIPIPGGSSLNAKINFPVATTLTNPNAQVAIPERDLQIGIVLYGMLRRNL